VEGSPTGVAGNLGNKRGCGENFPLKERQAGRGGFRPRKRFLGEGDPFCQKKKKGALGKGSEIGASQTMSRWTQCGGKEGGVWEKGRGGNVRRSFCSAALIKRLEKFEKSGP